MEGFIISSQRPLPSGARRNYKTFHYSVETIRIRWNLDMLDQTPTPNPF